MPKLIAFISSGQVEYSLDKASISIDRLIEQLQEALEEGATEVVGLSGNYRGASYVRLGSVVVDGDPEEDI